MKNLGIISWAVVLCCLLAGPSPALAFQWRGVSVTLPKGWEVSDKGARLTLETTRNGVVCLIKILAKSMTPKPVSDYQAWLDQYSAQWASFKFTNSVLDLQGPLTIYGHEHCPMASGQKKSMAVYQFLPRVESRIYSIVVNLEPYDQKTIPQFAADILEQISFAGHGGKIAATPGIPL
ncbi:MAG: hypothetical protein HUK40_17230 [Desulfobacter sp.]|nr:hypothetical protein [Desulfobacter sp.]